MDWRIRVVTLAGVVAVAACASVIGSTESAVQIRTNPAQARCDLKGREFTASVQSPAEVVIPHSAAPVTVNCVAPGFRPTSYTLDARSDGWIWGNSAFMVATGGIAVLGALVDESRGAGRNYAEEVQYDLVPDKARPIRARNRSGDVDLQLQAR
ncbi:hypothetical protein [Magnetospirillum sulfuroxidans]|uniref:Lipoprotein n=1 Tax=Magnetospirillum sulfuroxidans TaxID=611300 RepID=A0ABS5I7U9_9PROT|nr:hypothetical protein [Magnetospirillum sulfuroxidans]MBR9970492.1 hypothetical protein [Magnetospirillum sulfuroxidans]